MRKIKDFILKRLGIANLRQRVDSLEKKLKEQENRNRKLEREKTEIIHRINDLEKITYAQYCSLNDVKRHSRIIVSVTSFPDRIEYVPIVLKRMLAQTMKPDEIILWLSKEQFPKLEKELPNELSEMKTYGIKIEWCDGDIKAYKKFIPALKKYTEDKIIIIDDDLIYPTDHIEKLVKASELFPKSIIASRVHEIVFDERGKIVPYQLWKKECCYDTYKIKENWFFTGGAGTLLPPHIFGEEFFDIEVIEQKCPWADDIWLNIHSAINQIPIVNIATNAVLRRIDGTQENRLEDINCRQNQNDVQLRNVVENYKEKLTESVYSKVEF